MPEIPCVQQVTILIVDDNMLMRKGLIQLFSTTDFFNAEIFEASNGKEALSIIPDKELDLVIVDERMPEMHGLECSKKILQLKPDMKIIALTLYDSIPLILNYLKIGVRGFISKDDVEVDELISAVKSVLDGNYFFRSKYDQLIHKSLVDFQSQHIPSIRFTDRELQLVMGISKGLSNKETANSLGISVRTIETYRLDLMKKVGVKNTAELISYVYRNGIMG